MAIDFPSSPSDGQEWLDTQVPSSGTWKYSQANNSWTLVGGGASTANPLTFLGGHDFTQATEPDGSGASNAKQAGDLWVHDAATGAPDAVYALDTASISNGQLVVWDGNSYETLSGSPGYPNVDDGEGTTLDDRYLKLGANAGDQTVQSIGTTTFEGTVVVKSGNAQLNVVQNGEDFSFLAGDEPSFFKSNVYIGGTTSRNTRELWESTLTEEQKEQLATGTLTIPANVSTPGDGSFVRQWWYDQQSAEDQALIDAGELEYPEHFQAANFVDTFDLGDNTSINLLNDGRAQFGNRVSIGTKADAKTTLGVNGNISITPNSYISSNVYFDGANWRYIQNGPGSHIAMGSNLGGLEGMFAFYSYATNAGGADAQVAAEDSVPVALITGESKFLIGGDPLTAPVISLDGSNGNVDAASFTVNGTPLSATVESLQTLVATLQTRIETLEAAAGY